MAPSPFPPLPQIHLDESSHRNDRRRGVVSDYKFALAFEDISCRDYITRNYFDVASKMNVVPIGDAQCFFTKSMLVP